MEVIPIPWPALAMLVGSVLVVAVVLAFDVRATSLVNRTLDGLEYGVALGSAPRIDLGLGDRLGARIERSASPYRGLDRTLAIVEGCARETRHALRRAVRRGVIGLAALGVVAAIECVANSPMGANAWWMACRSDGMACTCRFQIGD